MKHKGGRDDVTVIVVDALSSSEDRLPALLQKTGSGATQGSTAPAHTVAVTKPLELQEGNRPWYPLEWYAWPSQSGIGTACVTGCGLAC